MKLTVQVQAAFFVGLLLMFTASIYGMWGLNRAFIEVADIGDNVYQQEHQIQAARNAFRIQVQEWKNVLLRGFDQKDFDQYWLQFEQQEQAVKTHIQALLKSQSDPQISAELNAFAKAHLKLSAGYRQAVEAFMVNNTIPSVGDRTVRGMDREPGELIGVIADRIAASGAAQIAGARAYVERLFIMSCGLLSVFLLSGFLISTLLIRNILRNLGGDPRVLTKAVVQLRSGDYSSLSNFSAKPLSGVLLGLDDLGKTLRSQQQDVSLQAKEVERVLRALDAADTAILVANSSGEVVFRNSSIKHLFVEISRQCDQTLPTELSQLSELLGVLGNVPENAKKHVVSVGSMELDVSLSSIASAGGNALGTVLELHDRSSEVSTLKQLKSVLSEASQGELAGRLHITDVGFLGEISKEVNVLLKTTDTVTGDLQRVLSAIAAGDLRQTVKGEYTGTFGRLFADCDKTVSTLTDVLGRIQQAGVAIEEASLEVRSGNKSLRARTTEQADALERTTAGMTQVQSMVEQNTKGAREASALVVEACKRAECGEAVVSDAMKAMQEVQEASQQIADIISVIDEIAFQTNLLALNAAVEAAHAGDEGRGFAVVAAEVQNLAQRSATAAREITSLIGNTVEKVKHGSKLVNESGNELSSIMASVTSVNNIVATIAGASAEQRDSIAHVARAIESIESSNQQNSALVEQVANSGDQVQEQVNALRELGGYFQLSSLPSHSINEYPASMEL